MEPAPADLAAGAGAGAAAGAGAGAADNGTAHVRHPADHRHRGHHPDDERQRRDHYMGRSRHRGAAAGNAADPCELD